MTEPTNINSTQNISPTTPPAEIKGDVDFKATPDTSITQGQASETKSINSTQETPKVREVKARGLKGAILALIDKIKNFFRRAPKQTAEQNKTEAADLQKQLNAMREQLQQAEAKNQALSAENERLKSNNFSAPASQDVSTASQEDTSVVHKTSQQNVSVSQVEPMSPEEREALKQKLAELEQQLANVAQTSERDLMQLLDSAPSTFISSDLLALLRNELPGTTNSIPVSGSVPPPPPPPPAPGGVPPPPPPPPAPGQKVAKILIKNPMPKSGTDFLEVVAKCRDFHTNGYEMDGTVVHDSKEFTERMRLFRAEVENRKVDNNENLKGIEEILKKIANQRDEWLASLENSPKLTAKELSDLRSRYALNAELFPQDADQLKALGLMTEIQYTALSNIIKGMDTQKNDLIASLEKYLSGQKSIEQREGEIDKFKLPLPEAPYVDRIFKLLKLEESFKEDKDKIEEILSVNYSKEFQDIFAKNKESREALEQQLQEKLKELDVFIDGLKEKYKDSDEFKMAYHSYEMRKDLVALQAFFKGKEEAKEILNKDKEIEKLGNRIRELNVSEEGLFQHAIEKMMSQLSNSAQKKWHEIKAGEIAVEAANREKQMNMAGK